MDWKWLDLVNPMSGKMGDRAKELNDLLAEWAARRVGQEVAPIAQTINVMRGPFAEVLRDPFTAFKIGRAAQEPGPAMSEPGQQMLDDLKNNPPQPPPLQPPPAPPSTLAGMGYDMVPGGAVTNDLGQQTGGIYFSRPGMSQAEQDASALRMRQGGFGADPSTSPPRMGGGFATGTLPSYSPEEARNRISTAVWEAASNGTMPGMNPQTLAAMGSAMATPTQQVVGGKNGVWIGGQYQAEPMGMSDIQAIVAEIEKENPDYRTLSPGEKERLFNAYVAKMGKLSRATNPNWALAMSRNPFGGQGTNPPTIPSGLE